MDNALNLKIDMVFNLLADLLRKFGWFIPQLIWFRIFIASQLILVSGALLHSMMCVLHLVHHVCSPRSALQLMTILVCPSSPFSAASGHLDLQHSSSLWRYVIHSFIKAFSSICTTTIMRLGRICIYTSLTTYNIRIVLNLYLQYLHV